MTKAKTTIRPTATDAVSNDAIALKMGEAQTAKRNAEASLNTFNTGAMEMSAAHAVNVPVGVLSVADLTAAHRARDTQPKVLTGAALRVAEILASGARLTDALAVEGVMWIDALHGFSVQSDTENVSGFRFKVVENLGTVDGKPKKRTHLMELASVQTENGFKLRVLSVETAAFNATKDAHQLPFLRAQLERAEANAAASGKKVSARFRKLRELFNAVDGVKVEA